MNAWSLPTSLTVNGVSYEIRTDFRAVLDILRACNDPDLPDWAKSEVMIRILFTDWESIPRDDLQEACKKAVEFIDCGNEQDNGKPQPRLMDWDQDAEMLIPAINKVYGAGDVRSLPHLHWWTFLGYYMEIGEGLFSSVLNIRHKRAKGKKLEKWERDFERENRRLIKLKSPESEEEKQRREAEEAALRELIG